MEKSLKLVDQGYDRDKRLYDDRTTWLAEVLDGSMRTSFEYTFDGQELYGLDGGPLTPVFKDALNEAEKIAAHSPNLAFELRRRYVEKEELECMFAMAQEELPNTMVVISDFPPELEDASQDIGGYNTTRKQTMMRVITKDADGKITMRSQSLDRSDRLSLEEIYRSLGFEPALGELLGQRMHLELAYEDQNFLADQLTGVYDRSLTSRYGGEWYAGRTPAEVLNTYDFVCSQSDLIETYTTAHKDGTADENLLYDLAAAMQNRFDRHRRGVSTESMVDLNISRIQLEMAWSGQLARASGTVFSGCGSSLGRENSVLGELNELGYGNKTNEETVYKFDKETYCVICQSPPKKDEGKKMCGPCKICKDCDTGIRKLAR